MFDAHKNFAVSSIATPPVPAISGITLTLQNGDGALMPVPPFNAVMWPAGQPRLASNSEIVRVTGMSGDTVTGMARAQEGTAAQLLRGGGQFQFMAAITAKTLTDIESSVTADAFALNPTAVKTSAYTVTPEDFVPVDITSGSVTVTLPAAPLDQARVGVKVVKVSGTPGSTSVTIARGGSDVFNVAGGSTSLTLTALFQGVLLQYQASTAIWYVQTADTPLNVALGAGKLGTDGTLGGPSGSPLSPSVVSDSSTDASSPIVLRNGKHAFGSQIGHRLMAKLAQNKANATITVISDSTADETTEWPYLVAVWLGARFPAYTVRFATWVDGGSTYPAFTTIQTGTGANTLTVYNCSVSGKNTTYCQAPYFDAMVASTQPDLCFVSHGHNITTGAPAFPATVGLFRDALLALTEPVNAACPKAEIVVIAQNPDVASVAGAANATCMDYWALATEQVAAERGYGFVNIWQTFIDANGGNALTAANIVGGAGPILIKNDGNGIHPDATFGEPLWAAEVERLLSLDAYLPPNAQSRSSLVEPFANIFTNGDFSNLGAASVPSTWTVSNVTFAKDTTNYEGARGYALQLTATAASASNMYQTFQAAALQPFLGKWATLAIRVYVPSGQASSSIGRVSLNATGGANPIQATNLALNQGFDGFKWVTVSVRVPIDCTRLDAIVYCDTSSTAGSTCTVDRAVLTIGALPRDIALNLPSPPATLFATSSGSAFGASAGLAGAVVDVTGTYGDLAGATQYYGVFSTPTWQPVNDVGKAMWGVFGQTIVDDTNAAGNLTSTYYGAQARAVAQGTGAKTISTLGGVLAQITSIASGQTVTTANGIRTDLPISQGTVGTWAGVNAIVGRLSGTAAATTLYGVYANTFTNTGSGTVVNAYGVYIDTFTASATTRNYALFSANTNASLLTGILSLGQGGATPAQMILNIRQASSQATDAFTVSNSANTPLVAIDSSGRIKNKASTNEQTTVGAAGAASAPPATPQKYLQVIDSAGTTYVVPLYKAS